LKSGLLPVSVLSHGRRCVVQCGEGPIEAAPAGFVPRVEQYRVLSECLAGIELGVWDERIVAWLAGWDWSAVGTIASWLRRVGSSADAGSPAP
jgi:hypothetical protein